MVELKLSKKTSTLWKIRLTLLFLIFIGLFSYYFHSYSWFLIAILAIVCLFEILLLWYIPNLFKRYRIKYVNRAVIVTSGVFIRTTHIMPFSKLIYTQTIVTPLSRLMGLRALTLKAARSQLLIPEMNEEDAELFIKVLAEGEL